MKIVLPVFPMARRVLAAGLTLLCMCVFAAEQPAASKAADARPLAVFVDDARAGKDPFYPDSQRRLQALAQRQAAPTNAVAHQPVVPSELKLKGISRSTSQPLALINTTTVAVGEAADVRCGEQAVKLRCLEIRDRSVLIEIVATGEVKELKLREGI